MRDNWEDMTIEVMLIVEWHVVPMLEERTGYDEGYWMAHVGEYVQSLRDKAELVHPEQRIAFYLDSIAERFEDISV